MRVGVYVDGFNVYYGAKGQMGKAPGWRWLDLRTLAAHYATWENSEVTRVVYCTARVNDPADRIQTKRQAFYLRALHDSGSVDVIEEGYYSSWAQEATMTVEAAGRRAPTALTDASQQLCWSSELRIRRTPEDTLLATVRKREEKGSDVNVATHLVVDVLTGAVDAAIVMSNDSDLALPLRIARQHVPVGLLNPSRRPLAGSLSGLPDEGVGGHWWRRIERSAWSAHQLPAQVGRTRKPTGW